MRAVLEIGEGIYKRVIDSEDHHGREESEIGRYFIEPGMPTPPVSLKGSRETMQFLNILTTKTRAVASHPSWRGMTSLACDWTPAM